MLETFCRVTKYGNIAITGRANQPKVKADTGWFTTTQIHKQFLGFYVCAFSTLWTKFCTRVHYFMPEFTRASSFIISVVVTGYLRSHWPRSPVLVLLFSLDFGPQATGDQNRNKKKINGGDLEHQARRNTCTKLRLNTAKKNVQHFPKPPRAPAIAVE